MGKDQRSYPESVDLLVVGSGPVGAAFARQVTDAMPDARVLMVECGPVVTDPPGINVRNLPVADRRAAQRGSEGPLGAPHNPAQPVPGTFLAVAADDGMPAARLSSNVGGMGSHWTCSTPRPLDTERNPVLCPEDLDAALDVAEALLGANSAQFPCTPTTRHVLDTLTATFAGRATDRLPRALSMACGRDDADGIVWAGTNTVLGPILGQDNGFRLEAETLCRQLQRDGDRISAAVLVDRRHGGEWIVRVGAVAVCADALRTPQLLWASGIRPAALGRYVNDHPMVEAGVMLPVTDEPVLVRAEVGDVSDLMIGAFGVPFIAGEHDCHGQIIVLDPRSVGGDRPVAGLTWYCPKQPCADDQVSFGNGTDPYGMPAINIRHAFGDVDRAVIARATRHLTAAAEALGGYVPGGEPACRPAGSSLHVQGTVRMGERDDGTSVCDAHSRVWGLRNLYVGGNGVIPTATACNPTLTSVALAVHAAADVTELLGSVVH